MVKWTRHALKQLKHIHDYIAQDSVVYAKRVTEAITIKAHILKDMPRIGRIVPEIEEETIREISIYSYRILYEIKQDNVEILAVIHQRRELDEDKINQIL
jgi:toxin ParE1/3/4